VRLRRRLAQHDLTVAAVASRQRISESYVRKLFESEGGSFSEWVLGERLIRTHRMLTDPRFAGRSITSVAFDAGFGDVSYFNRSFRRRFGATPSEIRAEAKYRQSQTVRTAVRRFAEDQHGIGACVFASTLSPWKCDRSSPYQNPISRLLYCKIDFRDGSSRDSRSA
jgi:AraC-like DNA-binding protein